MKKVCLISGSSPEFLGGISLYQKNLISYAKNKKLGLDFTWIYPGSQNREYDMEGIKCIEIKSARFLFLKEFTFSSRVGKYLEGNDFDIINSHANWGYFLKKYKKKENQKIIHIFHGVTYIYYKTQMRRFNFFQKILISPGIFFSYILEKYPVKKAEKIVCISEKVKREMENLYGKREKIFVLRTGVDLKGFGKISKEKARKDLGLEKNKVYGLYSGRGGYWNKGLDRAISISKGLYEKNRDYRLLVIGADENKCKKYLDFPFVEYKGIVNRELIPKYYSSADFFFSLSRYEGGAPTLALSEAVASKCLIVCSKDSDPEILEDNKDCLILDNYSETESERIIELLKDKGRSEKMKKEAYEKIKDLSVEKWSKRYFDILFN